MSDISVFTDKTKVPTDQELEQALGDKYLLWQKIANLTYKAYPEGKEEWNYSGKNYGWSFRIKDKRRAIIYLLPRSGFFKVGIVFGDKALADIMTSNIPEEIKNDLQAAKKYAEGRGVHIEINSEAIIPAVEKLVEIKLAY